MRSAFTAIVIHVIFLFAFFYFEPMEKIKKVRSHLKISQILLQPEIKEIAERVKENLSQVPLIEEKKEITVPEKENPPPAVSEKKNEKPRPQKEKKEKPVVKKQEKTDSLPKQKPVPGPSEKEKLASLIQQSLSNLENASATVSPVRKNVAVPNLKSEALFFEVSYQESLITFLEERLELPEKGNIKLRLTLNKNGTFVKVEILYSASEKNSNYLQQELCRLKFPSFQKHFPKEDVHSFTLTLTSEKSR